VELLTEAGHGGHVDLAGHGQHGDVPALFDLEPQIHGGSRYICPRTYSTGPVVGNDSAVVSRL
jgi:hypothetical protein